MEYVITRTQETDELYHYGVRGMKWGVRKSVKQLANHNRNAAVKSAKQDYRKGNITKAQKKAAIKEANVNKKNYLKDTKKNFESLPDRKAKREASKSITKERVSQVPHSRLKRGARLAKNILTGSAVAGSAAGAIIGTAAVPALGPLLLASNAVAGSAALGASWLGGKYLDRIE